MIGRTLTHYKVVEELGAGGMGVVYKALDIRLDRHVALKILPPDRSQDDDRRARFLHEARAASALNDPHIVTIFDIFTDDGTDVLVMEFVQGRTLRDILNDGPMPVATALDVALQVAEGVGTAHNAGIVHRDLKPGNVMLNDRGKVKVLDFGLAKLVGGASMADQPTMSSPATVAGMLLGTVDYMSPEQAKGDPIDGRSDVFSLGAMLYEMLTGERPFVSGHPLGVLHEILYGTIAPPQSKRPELSPDIDATVQRALERELARRYPTMEAFATDLRRARRDVEERARTAASASASVSPPPLPQPPRPAVSERPSVQTAVTAPPAAQPPVSQRVNVEPVVTGGSDVRPAVSERFGSSTGVKDRPASYTPAATVPPASSSLPSAWSGGWPRTRRGERLPKRKRKFWRSALTVIAILWALSWVRSWTTPSRVTVPRRPNIAGSSRSGDADRIGTAVEDAIADSLNTFGQNSSGIQLARGKIYWQRAQKNGDQATMKKAEDAFNQVLRLDPDDDEAQAARDALKEIAAAKTPPAQ